MDGRVYHDFAANEVLRSDDYETEAECLRSSIQVLEWELKELNEWIHLESLNFISKENDYYYVLQNDSMLSVYNSNLTLISQSFEHCKTGCLMNQNIDITDEFGLIRHWNLQTDTAEDIGAD